MGIKELWSILGPYCERKPLYELDGKIVAIDLSGWICESLNVVDYYIQPRMYLKNLFFRTCYLLLANVTPVFVLEGDTPPLKYGVVCKRNELQFRGAKPKNIQQNTSESQKNTVTFKKSDKGRTKFDYVLKQCEDLINSLGIQCVQGPGEAEAFCAYLNKDGLVDGIISQDSDCFGYGAITVFRNFSVTKQGMSAAQGGAVDVYDINRVKQSMDIGQDKMIILALLCGCDYCPGVEGVGKDSVMKLFNKYSEETIMERIKSWRINNSKYTELEMKIDDKSLCVNCGHYGRIQNHVKKGCGLCRTNQGCDASLWREERLSLKAELQIRKKALTNEEFPSQNIIDEFKKRPDKLPNLDLTWKQPNLVKFVKFMSKLLQWTEIYSFQKFLPLLTRWQLTTDCSSSSADRGVVFPDFIKKKRVPKGIASYEIIWKDEKKYFDCLIPDEQFQAFLSENPEGLHSLYSTVEPAALVEKNYPELVAKFLESKCKKSKKVVTTKEPKKQTKKRNIEKGLTPQKIKICKKPHLNSSLNDMTGLIEAIDDVEKLTKKKTKLKGNSKENHRKKKDGIPKGLKLIDQFFTMKQANNSLLDITNLDVNLNDYDEIEEDFFNISEIISDIVKQSPPIKSFNGHKLYYDNYETWNNNLSLTSNKSMDDIDLLIAKGTKNLATNKNHLSYLDLSTEVTQIVDNKSKFSVKNSLKNLPFTLPSNSTPIIVKKIIQRQRRSSLSNFKTQLPEQYRVPDSQTEYKEESQNENSVDVSFFFDKFDDSKIDLFEQSIDYKNIKDDDVLVKNDEQMPSSSSDEATIDYDFDINNL